MADLHLRVRTKYFRQTVAGEKPEDFRLPSPYWRKLLLNPDGTWRTYGAVVLHNAYFGGPENRARFPWRPPSWKEIVHEHFGSGPVTVIAIPVKPPVKGVCQGYEFPCTECGGDAWIGSTDWMDLVNKRQLVAADERLCPRCAHARGASFVFHSGRPGVS